LGKREAQNQVYDSVLKRMLEHQPAVLLPLLFPELPEAEVIEELNVEVILPPRRTDRVYKVRSGADGEHLILHVEFEASANQEMAKRLLIYHALLFEKYNVPILSMIVYPFEIRIVTPPLVEARASGKKILSFAYSTLPLWKLDARTYVEKRAVPFYGLLPTMQGADEHLLLAAIEEMVEWYRDDEVHLRDELLCFRVLLARARRLPEAELQHVERRIRMFDPLLEQDPWVQEKIAEGRAEGALQLSRHLLVTVVRTRFPLLGQRAERVAAHTADPEVLGRLIERVVQATNESEVRHLLEEGTA
jgi:hypothetical protein